MGQVTIVLTTIFLHYFIYYDKLSRGYPWYNNKLNLNYIPLKTDNITLPKLTWFQVVMYYRRFPFI